MTLSLLKAPVVKKLVLFLLLIFGRPDVGEAIKCVTCRGEVRGGQDAICDTNRRGTVQGCFIATGGPEPGCYTEWDTTNGNGEFSKGCSGVTSPVPKSVFTCIQKKFGQSGKCFKGTFVQFKEHWEKCLLNKRDAQVSAKNETMEERQGLVGKYETKEFCYCDGDQCNKDELRGGGQLLMVTFAGRLTIGLIGFILIMSF